MLESKRSKAIFSAAALLVLGGASGGYWYWQHLPLGPFMTCFTDDEQFSYDPRTRSGTSGAITEGQCFVVQDTEGFRRRVCDAGQSKALCRPVGREDMRRWTIITARTERDTLH